MKLHFFEDYLEQLYNQNKIETMFPDAKGNVMICCPFVHTKKEFNDATWEEQTVEYFEKIPSSSVNMEKRVFHCFTCGRSYNELEFAQNVLNKTKEETLKEFMAIDVLKNEAVSWKENQHKELIENEDVINKLHALKISDEVINNLNLGYVTNCLAIPVFKKDNLINVVRYNINKLEDIPKVRYNANTNSGDIVPFDLWRLDARPTIICEGEKDMLVARSHGFNAITLTGGSQSALQKEYLKYFKDKEVYICYDNDDAGKTGAIKLFKDLKAHTGKLKIINIGTVCKENKEDVTDFFIKYDKTADDFRQLIEESYIPEEKDLEAVASKHTLNYSKIESNIENAKFKKPLKSILQIIATCTEAYAIPEYALFQPLSKDDKDCPPKQWYANDSKEQFLNLIEGKVVSAQIPDILASQVGLSNKWRASYKCILGNLITIYKTTVTDQAREDDEKVSEFTIDLYSRIPLEIGSIYSITYRLYPHTKQGRKIIAIADEIEATSYEFDYQNEENIKSLDVFKVETTVEDKIDKLYRSAKCHIAPYLNKNLWFLMDLVFNSPLDITYKNVIRGALDIFVLGDTRTGKSETSRALKALYDFGEVVPLKTSTVASLIGGTDDKLKRTKLGVIPRFHKELVIMEEFSGAPLDFIKTLTEIRSSNMVKIYRVAGDIQAPCKLRMITISNPISDNGNLMLLSSYPNGVEPINELIKSPEDIARYDAFILVPRVEELLNPFEAELDKQYKIDVKHYRNKIKWVRALTSDNVVIDYELGSYIFEKGKELNKLFESSFTLFGSETDKKIAKMASALACMLCSTNCDHTKVLVTKEHVDYIINFLKEIYDNNAFRLKEFATEEKAYKEVNEADTQLLQEYYPKNVTFIDFLSNSSKVNRNELQTVSGLGRDEFSKIFNSLVARKFIKLTKDQVIPTVKFRNTYHLIDKSFNLSDVKVDDTNVF